MTDDKPYWIALSMIDGLGPAKFNLLRQYFGSAEKVYKADEKELRLIGLGDKLIDRLVAFRKSNELERQLSEITRLKITVLTTDQIEYPNLLKQTINPPYVLYVKHANGVEISKLFALPLLSVVGTRKVTPYGRQVTQIITSGLVANGFGVVSGLALGVDGIAHQTALDNKGITIAVMGCGLNQIYPASNRRLADQIIESGGAWVSEYPVNSKILPSNFPARNRIVSGLALGVVVTEAAEDSGSLITAKFATEQGREVFAIPGPITSQVHGGIISLLKQGAIPVAGVNDIVDSLPGFKRKIITGDVDKQILNLSDKELAIVNILKNNGFSQDDISRMTGCLTEEVGETLSLLEVKGLIVSDNGQYFLCK